MKSPIIVALDFNNLNDALALADKLDPTKCRLKVGKELFTRVGPHVLDVLHKKSFEVFLDLKFHDIPNTTAQAVLAAADMGVWMVNIHASVGHIAMQTCVERLKKAQLNTKLIAVTVLTSTDTELLASLGVNNALETQVLKLAKLSQDNGLDGVVCSAQEAVMLRQQLGDDFLLVTPGIRMPDDNANDQKRICTPKQAIDNGASHLVIGRSITKATDPLLALERILESLA